MNQMDITDYFTSSYIPCKSLNVETNNLELQISKLKLFLIKGATSSLAALKYIVSNYSFSISVVMIIFAPPNPISSDSAEKSMTVI